LRSGFNDAVIEPRDLKEIVPVIAVGGHRSGAFECEVHGFKLWVGADIVSGVG